MNNQPPTTGPAHSEKFEEWAIIEIMGHARYAGLVTEQAIGGTSFVRVDVPEVDGVPGFSKLFGSSAIFSITPTTRELAIDAIKHFGARPITVAGFSAQRLTCHLPEDEFD
jgi:hypothetical protein